MQPGSDLFLTLSTCLVYTFGSYVLALIALKKSNSLKMFKHFEANWAAAEPLKHIKGSM